AAEEAEHSAERARLAAEDRRAEAVRQQAALKKSNDEAQKARKRAQANLFQAQEAVNQLIEVAQRRLPNEPHLVQLRVDLLNTALGFCERFRTLGSDNPAVVLQAAQTWRLVGDIREALGEHVLATEAYATSARLYGDLKGPDAGSSPYRAELAGTHLNLGVV